MDIVRENLRGYTKRDYVSEEESAIQGGNRTPRTRSRVRGVIENRRRQRGREFARESEEWEDDSEKSGDDQDSLCMILAEEKMRNHDRELQTDPSPGTSNLEQQDAYGREELEKRAVSRKPFRELSCNSNVRTKLDPDDDREVLRRIVCVKLKDNIHSPEN